MIRGVQRQLMYVHRDGSFSAFGERCWRNDKCEGSLWLSAFVLRVFSEISEFSEVDFPNILNKTAAYLLESQNPRTGAFPHRGEVFSTYLLGGVDSEQVGGSEPPSVTAFGVIAMKTFMDKALKVVYSNETGTALMQRKAPYSNAINSALQFLSRNRPTSSRYTQVLELYALSMMVDNNDGIRTLDPTDTDVRSQ